MKYIVARDVSCFVRDARVGDDVTESGWPKDTLSEAIATYLYEAKSLESVFQDPLTFMVNLSHFRLFIIKNDNGRDVIAEIVPLDTVDMEGIVEAGENE